MTINERIEVIHLLGDVLEAEGEAMQQAIQRAKLHNPWFTKENSRKALKSLAQAFLDRETLQDWVKNYEVLDEPSSKTVGLVLAGNIPAVGFHDVMSVFVAGYRAKVKLSSKDQHLMQFLIDQMIELDDRVEKYIQVVPMLKDFDAVIATGSNNSSIYFEQYFSKVPNIIRKNRNSVAVLTGEESKEDFRRLADDIFQYFGLGCRSVSKLYVPKDYDFVPLLETLDEFKDIMGHHKYRNNYDYNRSIYLLNRDPHLANDCIMILEDESPLSRIAALHYQYYENLTEVETHIEQEREKIQCIASSANLSDLPVVELGQTQAPAIDDYADDVDTLEFLVNL